MKHNVRSVVEATLASLKQRGLLEFPALPAFAVEAPKQAEHGDFSCNVAMLLQKVSGKRGTEIADLIVNNLVDPDAVVKSVERAGPGFLNFRLADRVFQIVPREILAAGKGFGRQPANSTGKRALVEFVSANPTGPVHIGHARGAFMGDAIARLMDAAGYAVTREFYINDFGKQVETLGRTVYKRYLQLFGQHVELAEGEYPADYVIEIAKSFRDEVGDKYVAGPEKEAQRAAMLVGIRENLKTIRATLEKANIAHDVYFSEASLHESGEVLKLVEAYRARGVTYEANVGRTREQKDKVRSEESKAAKYADQQKGGTFLMTATYQENGKYKLKDDEDRVILRSDGSPVYLTADLAYHKQKFERGFDVMVNVFGADHSGHVPRIESGMALLGNDTSKLKFVLVQIVRITRGGEEVKVSKRKGTVFELVDLIEEAGADACRFLFLMKTRDAQIDFDLDLIAHQSRENPVFYFQYGHARCAGILRKAREKGIEFTADAVTDAQLARLTLAEEKALLKKMSQLPEVVTLAAERLEPHHVLYFCQDLIADFHSYYTQYKSDPIVSSDVEKSGGRLALVAALKQTLQSAFNILGIDAPDHMELQEESDTAAEN
ncbi:MAG TPA: arginine--tRNA ligase [Polyangiaceae bacterium]|nr:arginine--tRNA ligase [Polyangiaceae bacterium]